VEVVRRRDDHRVEVLLLEQILDVREDVRHPVALGDRARLLAVVVAERRDLHAAHLRQDGQVGGLWNRADADQA
jgi:hypothetical protein